MITPIYKHNSNRNLRAIPLPNLCFTSDLYVSRSRKLGQYPKLRSDLFGNRFTLAGN